MSDTNVMNILGSHPTRKEILAHWEPENPEFWEKFGKKIATQNLWTSTWSLLIAFVAWTLWATIAANLNKVGFHFTDAQIFSLAALPGLVGATFRFVYTYMPGLLGGKTWTFISTAILLIPVIWLGQALGDTSTSYDTFFYIVALLGLAGANFASSMANIGFFFPKAKKGTAAGINGGLGNLGVSVIFLASPIVTGLSFGGLLGNGLVTTNGNILYLQNLSYFGVASIIITLLLIALFMDDLPTPKPNPKAILSIISNKHTWLLTWLYTCGFGSFIGYSAALAILVAKEFPEVSFSFAAFLGPFIGASLRSVGGWLADKVNSGATVTFWSLLLLLVTAIGVLTGIQVHNFILFFISFMILFLSTGFANGAIFRMIPFVFPDNLQASLVTGFTASVAAYGAFFIPKLFGIAYSNFGQVAPAFYVLIAFTLISTIITWIYYARKGASIKA